MASWVDAEAATGSVPFRLHARTSSQAVLFRPCNAGDRFERSRKRAPFPAGITNLVTRRPPLPVTLHGRMVPFIYDDTGFPIALSYPHFYKSDPSILEAIEGLNPKPELHESYAYIQPKSGLPLKVAFRFQINMALQNIEHMARVEKFGDMVLPLLWFEIGMNELPLSMYIRFWFYLNFLPILQDVVTYSSLIIGIILISVGICKIFVYSPNKSTSARQWLNSKMKNQKLQFFNNRRTSCKINEMDTYSSLIESKNVNTMPEGITKLLSLKEDIV